VKANYGIIAGRTNLHSIWDGYLAERGISTPPAGPRAILSRASSAERAILSGGTVEDWSREGWEVARAHAYASLIGDSCGPKPEGRPVLDEADVRSLIPVLRRQILAGGLRLAGLLDDALGPEARAPGQKRAGAIGRSN
jgi:hypothetical protein